MDKKKVRAVLTAALLLILPACGGGQGERTAPPGPSPTAGVPVSAPPETQSPEQLLARQPIDDSHDAFLVDTGGKLGTLLVTVEMGEFDEKLWESPLYFAVWNPADMSRPIQKMEKTTFNVFDWHAELDANFDGFGDFSYTYAMGNQPSYDYLWVWDEDRAWFVEVPEYAQISSPRCNPETGIIDGWARNSGGGDGVTTFHRWEDGKLVCVRRIETGYDYENGAVKFEVSNEVTYFPSWIKVEDRIDGELTQVYYRYYSVDEGTDFFPEREKWEHLDYHGED